MPRELKGKVISNSMDKTVSVAVDRVKTHPIYRKQYAATSKFLAHDENNDCQVGDKVTISETRPKSRRKRWVVKAIDRTKEASS